MTLSQRSEIFFTEGGGNAKHIDFELPEGVEVVPNVAGILGGIRLWEDEGH